MHRVTLDANVAVEKGGGIHHRYGSLAMTNTLLVSNQAAEGGGLSQEHGTVRADTVNIKQNTGLSGFGGGMQLVSVTNASMIDVSFESNTAWKRGGGVYVHGTTAFPSLLSITRGTLGHNKQLSTGNRADWGGGGLFARYQSHVVLREISFDQNVASFNRGHQIMTYEDGVIQVPRIWMQEANITNAFTRNNFYGNADGAAGSEAQYVDIVNATCTLPCDADACITNIGCAVQSRYTSATCACQETPFIGTCRTNIVQYSSTIARSMCTNDEAQC